jgi:hypothetical protein
MNPRLWQRQPGESPADFTAFVACLRLKGRRSARAVAALTGRSLGTIRRLSAKFNWRGRVAAFEARLADATQDALDSVLHRQSASAKADLEQLRIREYLLALEVAQASRHWLKLANNPRRRQVSLMQICRLTELAFHLARLAAGMPTGDKPRRPRKEDRPGYWTNPSVEEALKKIYGDKSTATDSVPGSTVVPPLVSSVPPETIARPSDGRPPELNTVSGEAGIPASHSSAAVNPLSLTSPRTVHAR